MRTRRSVLLGVGGLIAIAGCSQQSGQPAEEGPDTEGASGEFGIDQFRVGGENPDEYEAEFIAGSNASEVADELTPEVSYQISGASGEVETEVQYEYSDATIPEGEPLDQTVEGATHDGNGEYAQVPSMPDSLVSEIVENPKNLAVTFRATDTGSEGQASKEYELDFADSFGEQIIREAFQQDRISAVKNQISVEEGTVTISYEIDSSVGTFEFNKETASVAGVYTGIVDLTDTVYSLDLTVKDADGETFEKSIDNKLAMEYLNGEITEDEFNNQLTFDYLKT